MRDTVIIIYFCLIHFSIAAQAPMEYQEVKPLQGEGAWTLLRRFNLTPQEHLEEFKRINEGKFSPEGGILSHHTYLIPLPIIENNEIPASADVADDKSKTIEIPAAEKKWIEPIFGEKHQELTLIDDELKGAVFFLVSGHGGPDPGAIGQYGKDFLYEDEYAYDITLRLAKNLMQKGAKVHIIVQDPNDGIRSDVILKPDVDETVMGKPIPLDQIQRLKQRTDAINMLSRQETAKYQRCIEIHLDSRSQKQQLDVFFYHHENSTAGKQMAETLRKTFEENYRKHQPNRGFSGTVTHRNLYMLRNTRPVAVFVELGNIRNFRDQQRFVVESNRQALANWLTNGIVQDYKNYLKQ
jgi:N-acetylmuramoyl-L-alanine amidase